MKNPLLFAALPCAIAAGIAALPAHAEDGDDRFVLRLGAMYADGSIKPNASGEVADYPLDWSGKLGFGSRKVSPRVDGVFRLSTRQRLIFDYFQYKKHDGLAWSDASEILGQDLSGAASLRYGGKFQLASLVYDYSVVDTPNFSMGLELGGEWAKLGLDAHAHADVDGVAGVDGPYDYTARWSDDGIAPVVGVRFSGKAGEHVRLNLQAQYLDASWGSFDYDGKIKRANANVEYMFTDNFGAFVGYDYFKVNYEDHDHGANYGADLKFHGPTAGVTLAF
jgi:hypothetical protein